MVTFNFKSINNKKSIKERKSTMTHCARYVWKAENMFAKLDFIRY